MEAQAQLFAALAKARAEFEPVHFDSTNPHFKNKFASINAMHAATMPALTAHGLMVVQMPIHSEHGLSVKTVITHAEGGCLEFTLPMPPTKPDPQGYGSAISYARRYAYAAALSISGEEDDDGTAASENVKAPAMAKTAIKALGEGDWPTLLELARDEDYKEAWKLLGSKDRSAIKALEKIRDDYRDRLAAAAMRDDDAAIDELVGELTDREKKAVWSALNADTKAHIKTLKETA